MQHNALRAQRKRTDSEGLIGLKRSDQLLLCPLGQRLGVQRDGSGLDSGEIGFFRTQMLTLHHEHLCMA